MSEAASGSALQCAWVVHELGRAHGPHDFRHPERVESVVIPASHVPLAGHELDEPAAQPRLAPRTDDAAHLLAALTVSVKQRLVRVAVRHRVPNHTLLRVGGSGGSI